MDCLGEFGLRWKGGCFGMFCFWSLNLASLIVDERVLLRCMRGCDIVFLFVAFGWDFFLVCLSGG